MPFEGKFEVRNAEVEEKLKGIGHTLKDLMPPGFGFVLLISSYGEKGSTFYIASVERQDVCNMMREFIQKSEHN